MEEEKKGLFWPKRNASSKEKKGIAADAPEPDMPESSEPTGHTTSHEAKPAETPGRKKSLGEQLLEKGLISPDQYQVALKIQREEGMQRNMGLILAEMGFITESALAEIQEESSGIESFDIRSAALDPKLIKSVPKEVEMRSRAVPVYVEADTVTVAISDVFNIIAIDQIRRYFPRHYKVIPVYSPESDILEVIDQYHDYELSVDGIIREIETGRSANVVLSGETEGYVNPMVRLVDSILVDAIKNEASDIHFEPEGSFLRLRYRIDGQMRQIRSFHKDYWAAIAVRVKIMSGINIAETRIPQDGRITYTVLGRKIDFRVATQPTIHGENIVMRILDTRKSLLPFGDLGFEEENIHFLKRLLKRPEGIIIVTGPTGSGKTTTLYAILNYINSITENIMTLEDPVEYQIPLLRQTNVREITGMTFSEGIRSMMRQDPDIIFVGEVRDEDTANMAIRAAMTGHQVFTTMHTNDALGAIPRIIDIGIKPHLLSGNVIALMAQRLTRRLCLECRQAYKPSPEECSMLGVDPKNPPHIYKHVGCPACANTGYKGRIAIVEILRVEKGLDDLIHNQAPRSQMMQYALENGFIPMQKDGILKVLAGITDIDELVSTIDMTDWL